jgi:hypothetical protein
MSVALENVMVAVPGWPEGSLVSVEVSVEGMTISGFGTLPWMGSRIDIEDRAPKGVRIEMIGPGGASSVFFVPAGSLPSRTALADFERWLQGTVAQGGGVLAGRLSVA